MERVGRPCFYIGLMFFNQQYSCRSMAHPIQPLSLINSDKPVASVRGAKV